MERNIITDLQIFAAGDVVDVATEDGAFMKAVPYFNSTDLALIQGHNSTDIENLLGKGRKDVIFRPEDTAIIE